MKTAFLKDIFREIGGSKSRFFSIFAIIALGAGFFAGLKATCPDMLTTQEHYFENRNLMDIRLVSTYGFDEKDMEAIRETEDIREVYPAYSKDVFIESSENGGIIAKLMSVPDKGMNSVVLLEGRLPENSGECLVEKHSQMTEIYEIGDTVNVYTTDSDDPIEDSLSRTSWKVVGFVMTPQYIAYDRGTASIGDGSADTFIMVPEENFTYDVFTEVYITLDSTKGIPAFDEGYSSAVEAAVENFESLAEKREPQRLEEIIADAEKEISDAKAEIADAEKELSDAEKELADAYTELTDAEKELKDGWNEYYNGLKEYREGKAEFESEIADAEKELEDGENQLSSGWAEYNEGKAGFESGYAQFMDGLSSAGITPEDLYNNRKTIEDQIAQIEAIPEAMRPPMAVQGLAYLKTQLAEINSTIAVYEQLLSAKAELDSAYDTLRSSGKELLDGRKELDEAKADGQKELDEAAYELYDGYKDLTEGEKELADGWEEYYDGLEEFEEAKAEADAEIADAKIEIADAEEELKDLKEPVWYVFTREDNPGYSSYESDVYIIESVGKVFPIFFFLVAMLVCLTTMTRMVEEQRTQIGTMKALGYGKGAIMAKFIVYSSFASISGAVFGVGLCNFVFPIIIYAAYAMRYIIPDIEFVALPGMWLLVIAVCVLCTSLAVIMSCYAELRSNPAELMRPKAPKAGKRVLLERIPFIWKRLNFNRKVTVRNLFRYKKRIFMTILGIAGCAALTITGFGLFSSISVILEKQYSELFNYDLIVALDTDAKEEERRKVLEELDSNEISAENLKAFVKAAQYEGLGKINLVVPESKEEFKKMVTFRDRVSGEVYELTDEGIIITERLAEMFGLSAGDEMTFYSDEREFTAKITAITEHYAMHFIYMTPALYEDILGEEVLMNSVFTIMSDDGKEAQEKLANTLTEYDGVLALSFSRTAMDSFNDTVQNLNYVVVLIIVCAAALAFVVLYNLTNINITERVREIATIKVLGFYDGEVSAYVFRENFILSILGAMAGLLLGKALHAFVIGVIQTDEIMFGRGLPLWVYAVGFVMTLIFSMLVNGIMFFRLKKISMVESLKSVE